MLATQARARPRTKGTLSDELGVRIGKKAILITRNSMSNQSYRSRRICSSDCSTLAGLMLGPLGVVGVLGTAWSTSSPSTCISSTRSSSRAWLPRFDLRAVDFFVGATDLLARCCCSECVSQTIHRTKSIRAEAITVNPAKSTLKWRNNIFWLLRLRKGVITHMKAYCDSMTMN